MAITQKNPTTFSYSDLSDAQTQTYKGKADITISEYNTDSAPDVKVGSVFENNGSLFIVDTSDITPTGYSGISNSTTFYLYFDASAVAFIYSSTVPVWSDALQGHYNGNDRAFFSMYKDTGGTLYQGKNKLEGASRLLSKIIPIGDWDMDSTASVSIVHGLTLSNIRTIKITIINDDGTQYTDLPSIEASGSLYQGVYAGSTSITIFRAGSGYFDKTNYNATSFNRGWITIQYVE